MNFFRGTTIGPKMERKQKRDRTWPSHFFRRPFISIGTLSGLFSGNSSFYSSSVPYIESPVPSYPCAIGDDYIFCLSIREPSENSYHSYPNFLIRYPISTFIILQIWSGIQSIPIYFYPFIFSPFSLLPFRFTVSIMILNSISLFLLISIETAFQRWFQ